jgi:autotransporter-associated beta strand protein
MKARLQLLVSAFIFSVFGPASSPAVTLPPSFNWVTAPVDGLLTNSSNWVGGIAPSTGADLVFGSTSHPFVNFDTSLDVNSITFTSGYSPYFFDANSVQTLSLSNGITLPASSTATVHFGPNLSIELLQSQTWTIDGSLTVHGDISEPTATTSTLTKTGAGTLTLGGSNVFSGGVNVQQGTLRFGSTSFEESESTINNPVGTGTLSLASGTTLASDVDDLDLHNDITLGSAVTNNHVTFDTGDFGGLFLDGDLTAGSADTTIYLAGENTLEIIGTIDGPAQTDLVFASAGSDIGSAAFGATFTSNIQSITADNAALFFFIAPSSPLTLAAVNRGYIGAAVNVEDVTPISPNALLSQIANPGSYAGTFGVDTDPDMGTPHVFTEALDFTHFTHPDFRFGSHTMSVVAGPISPVVNGTTSLYPFGGGSGHLVIASDLIDAPGAPASVLVSSHAGTEPQYVILRGNNSFTGSYTLDGVAAQLAVQRAIAVLDSPTALPGTSSTFTFGAGEHAYIGATEAAFPSFNSFLARLAPGGHNPLSILGLDSRDMFDVKIAHGEDAENYTPRQVNETIDLRSFSSIYLGSASDVRINGTIHAPGDGVLRLTGVDDGRLTVAGQLGTNVSSVEIGSSAGGSEEFGDGTIEMRALQTYSGGTTLRSGKLAIGTNSHYDHGTQTLKAGPIGTGTLTVASGISGAILTAADTYRDFYNSIVLNAPLQVGERIFRPTISIVEVDSGTTSNELSLFGDISGSGGLKIHGDVMLAGNNTYTGGTEIVSSWVMVNSANPFGSGPITFRTDDFAPNLLLSTQPLTLSNALSLSGSLSFVNSYGDIKLTGPVSLEGQTTLQFSNYSKVKITGAISGMNSLSIDSSFNGSIWLGDSVTAPTNTYQGGTNVWSGIVVFANPAAIPVTGLLTADSNGYVGAAFNSSIQSSFLNRFDKGQTYGSVGFDSADLNTPTIVAENIDLTGFNPSVRLGSSTAATITGTITPASSSSYEFGGGGGELTIASDLGGNRIIHVNSSTLSPLTLVLKGDNSATNGLSVTSSIVRFDGAAALPGSGSFTAADFGYIGYTENVSSLTPSSFLGRFGVIGDNAIIGFDSANVNSPRSITDNIALNAYSTSFSADTYIGTSTAINLDGTLTAYAGVLNLTGVGHGRLMVNSPITSANATSLVIGTPHASISGGASVTLNNANSYTGGTLLRHTHLTLGNASALGTGTLTNDATFSQLSVNMAGLNIANAINTGSVGHELNLSGPNGFTLSGNISGTGSISKTGSSTITLSGANSGLSGGISINEGKLIFAQDTSAGTGGLQFSSINGAMAEFTSAAPSIGSLSGYSSSDQILLATNSILTVNQDASYDESYQGTISGSGASVVFQTQTNSILNGGAAPLAETSIPVRDPRITLYGANTYTGGTTIRDGVTVVAANSAALGTVGNVTIDGGTLALSPGTSLTFDATSTRQLVFTSGRIAGHGTLVLANNLTIGAQQTLSPGLDFSGKLSFSLASSAVLTFASGGTYQWKLADAGGAPTGWGALQVDGTVDITAGIAPGSTFDLELHTVNPSGSSGFAANFNPYVSMSWAVLTATNITNFAPAKFNIVTTDFLNATHGGTFSLSIENSNTLLLNFTPVPEPSTWALLISGLAVVAFTALRRRK